MTNSNRFFYAIMMFPLIFILSHLVAFSGIHEVIVENVKPKVTGSKAYEVQSVEFSGEQTFWKDSREVLFETEEGTFVYPKNHVTYEMTDGDNLSIEVVSYDRMNDRVVLRVNEENVRQIRTRFAEQFSENINIKD